MKKAPPFMLAKMKEHTDLIFKIVSTKRITPEETQISDIDVIWYIVVAGKLAQGAFFTRHFLSCDISVAIWLGHKNNSLIATNAAEVS